MIPTLLLSILSVCASAAIAAGDDSKVPPLVAPDASQPDVPTAAPSVGLTPVRKWHALGTPLLVDVTADGTLEPVTLVLLDDEGAVLARSAIAEHRIDVRRLMPVVDTVERAVFLQATIAGESVGTPLVIEPLRTPARLRTRERVDESGEIKTQVIGWDDRPLRGLSDEDLQLVSRKVLLEPKITAGFCVTLEEDALLHTDRGDMRIAFAHDEAPATGSNFRQLAREGFYDGLTFHRIAAVDRFGNPFVIQGGDPAGTGDGTPGYAITLEESDLPFGFGVVGMARADDPHSIGCQFFIGLSRQATERLDGQYSAFGYCVEGGNTIRAIESCALADPATQKPMVPPRILSVQLVPAPPRIAGQSRVSQCVDRAVTEQQPNR